MVNILFFVSFLHIILDVTFSCRVPHKVWHGSVAAELCEDSMQGAVVRPTSLFGSRFRSAQRQIDYQSKWSLRIFIADVIQNVDYHEKTHSRLVLQTQFVFMLNFCVYAKWHKNAWLVEIWCNLAEVFPQSFRDCTICLHFSESENQLNYHQCWKKSPT